jgi:ribonuclease HI
MIVHAYTDGASRGNPGESGIGIILKRENGSVIRSAAGYIGKTTNNVAEYQALMACIAMTKQLNCTRLVVYSDSELMVRQMKKVYRVKDKNLKKLYALINEELSSAPFSFDIHHVERAENHEADSLANAGIDSRKRIKI